LELGELLLEAAPDDFEDADQVRRLLRDLREVRMAKLRDGVDVLEAGGGVQMNGVGGMEVAEGRAFIGGVVDGLRYVLCLSKEGQVKHLLMSNCVGKSMLQKNRRDVNERMTKGKMDTLAPPAMMTKICFNEKDEGINMKEWCLYRRRLYANCKRTRLMQHR
jgi:hypothetical protein